MANLIIRPDWYIPESRVTPEKVALNRRQFLKEMGFTGAIAGLAASSLTSLAAEGAKKGYPYARNPKFNPGWPLANERDATTYNNFYEFTTDKEAVHEKVGLFKTSPWTLDIGGLVENPMKIEVQELIAMMNMEERVYRFRCVEAWSMIVPWTGFPLKDLIEKVKPNAEAKFIKFQTAMRPAEMPGVARLLAQRYPLPYTEGLRMDEAMHDLTIVSTGLYGKPMPKQNGAPIRIVVPWKYGYKSIKSIEKIEFVATQPKTLWETLAPIEYPFESNVDPRIPHPRWSQATERVIGSSDRIRTQYLNGYADQVGALYKKG